MFVDVFCQKGKEKGPEGLGRRRHFCSRSPWLVLQAGGIANNAISVLRKKKKKPCDMGASPEWRREKKIPLRGMRLKTQTLEGTWPYGVLALETVVLSLGGGCPVVS